MHPIWPRVEAARNRLITIWLRAAPRAGTIESMDSDQVTALRMLLGSSTWLQRARSFARALRGAAPRTPGGLLIVGTPDDEPWHLAAHLDQESRLAQVPGLAPTLVRWAPPPDAPPHLRIGLERIEAARRGETLFVVSANAAPSGLLERVHDARTAGATVLAMDAGDPDLDDMAHESLAVAPGVAPVSFDAAQHLVSAAAGEPTRTRVRLRGRLARLLDTVSGQAGAAE
jgi:hypothetical protein